MEVTAADVKAAIMTFPNGSAGGPDGLRPQHLKDMITSGGVGTDVPLLQAITDLINAMLAGRTPEAVKPVLFGGALTALLKKDGGVRPIAVGYVWRRIAGKVACNRLAARSAALLAPRQLGFGVAKGCESAVHAARRYVQNMQLGQVFLKIDFRNAFNSVRRDVILEAVARHFPELLEYTISAYGAGSDLRFGCFTVPSDEGAQQGDPLGPLFFCLAVHELLSALKSELVLGYLDDIATGGDARTVLSDFVDIENKAASLGLILNRAKCEISGHTADTRALFVAAGVSLRETETADLILLGSPLLPGVGVDKAIADKRSELETLSRRLQFMPAHDSLFLMRNIVSMPRLLYTLRTAPCTGSNELVLYDALVKSILCTTLNSDITDAVWRQASLPVRWGGLGTRGAVLLAPSAYLASAAGATVLLSRLLPVRLLTIDDPCTAVALTAWRLQVNPSALPPDTSTCTQQSSWDNACCQQVASSLLDEAANSESKARLLASVEDTAGAWLNTVPILSLGLKLSDDAVRVAVALRLGTNICEPHDCICGQRVNALGTHGLACKRSAGRHPRHSELNDTIWRALQRAQIPSAKEPTGLSRTDHKRPDGVTMIPWAQGRCLTWDVTSPDTLAASHLAESAVRAGSAAAKAETAKTAKYVQIAITHAFVPLAFESLGAWGVQCQKFVSELGRRITTITGDARETSYLRQRLSIAVQRGNAIACRGTMSHEPDN
jgi:hypothetical protein